MRTRDIHRLADVFADLRDGASEPLLLAGPVYDDLYNATEGVPSIVNRRVGVREMAVYGRWFNHVFFQRYGYTIPGYGVIGEHAPTGHQRVHPSRLRGGRGLGRGHRVLRNRFGPAPGKRPGHRRRLASRSPSDIPDGARTLPLVPRLRLPQQRERQAQVLLLGRTAPPPMIAPLGNAPGNSASRCTPCGPRALGKCIAWPRQRD